MISKYQREEKNGERTQIFSNNGCDVNGDVAFQLSMKSKSRIMHGGIVWKTYL